VSTNTGMNENTPLQPAPSETSSAIPNSSRRRCPCGATSEAVRQASALAIRAGWAERCGGERGGASGRGCAVVALVRDVDDPVDEIFEAVAGYFGGTRVRTAGAKRRHRVQLEHPRLPVLVDADVD